MYVTISYWISLIRCSVVTYLFASSDNEHYWIPTEYHYLSDVPFIIEWSQISDSQESKYLTIRLLIITKGNPNKTIKKFIVSMIVKRSRWRTRDLSHTYPISYPYFITAIKHVYMCFISLLYYSSNIFRRRILQTSLFH